MSKQVNIDRLTIRLPAGWQGDPVYLARKVAEQLQNQAGDLPSSKEIRLSVQGHYAGVSQRAAQDVQRQLAMNSTASRPGGKPR